MPADQSSTGAASGGARRLWRFVPFVVFLGLGAVFAVELYDADKDALPSALIDRPAPAFEMPSLRVEGETFSTADLKTGEVSVLNLWASWCGPCRVEQPELVRLAETTDVTLYGVAYRDKPEASMRFLQELGDPFDKIGKDEDGQTSLRWGVSGVPETFVISGDGTIVYKHVGPIQNDDMEKKILPAIEAAKAR